VIVCAAVLLLRYRDGRRSDSAIRPYDASAYATIVLSLLLLIWGFKSPHLGDQLTGFLCAPIAFWVGVSYRNLPLVAGRPFTAPFAPLTPMLGIVTCVWLMMASPKLTWIRFFAWLVVGMFIYFFYGIRNSTLNRQTAGGGELGFSPGEP
jgi:APA family basic amino acid/polyamine antiporter